MTDHTTTMRDLNNLVDQAERVWANTPRGNLKLSMQVLTSLDAAHAALKTAYDRLPEDSPLRDMYADTV